MEKLLGSKTAGIIALEELFTQLDLYGLANSVNFDISVIRGLGYYTGIVFECFDSARALRAIFGGGRYDNLLEDVGGKPDTAVGLGFGDVVLSELLIEKGIAPACQKYDVAVGYMTDAEITTATRAAHKLRGEGHSVDLALTSEKPKTFFGRVGKGAFSKAVYIGPDDVAAGTANLKDLESGEQSGFQLS